jgi:hypothetical protein
MTWSGMRQRVDDLLGQPVAEVSFSLSALMLMKEEPR